ncbi:MAG TPA: chromate resistance protein ChrB domain-containing protein [Candidatus Saccharimonadales bacterium]|nr:chromate resistance protein ChrB domain-containing protein [Candidatus Saccharimonadales bacterium]
MKWFTRQNAHVDRTACPWLIRRLIDPEAEFVFVPGGTDPESLDGHTFDMRGADYSHEGMLCTFQVMLERHHLTADPGLVAMGRIIADVDVPPRRGRRPEAAGIDAVLRGLQPTVPDDHEKLRVTAPLYDALYAYCQDLSQERPVRHGGLSRPRLSYGRRTEIHLAQDDERESEGV